MPLPVFNARRPLVSHCCENWSEQNTSTHQTSAVCVIVQLGAPHLDQKWLAIPAPWGGQISPSARYPAPPTVTWIGQDGEGLQVHELLVQRVREVIAN